MALEIPDASMWERILCPFKEARNFLGMMLYSLAG